MGALSRGKSSTRVPPLALSAFSARLFCNRLIHHRSVVDFFKISNIGRGNMGEGGHEVVEDLTNI